MDCRSGCGACCIAPSISSPIPGMPEWQADEYQMRAAFGR